MQLRFSHTVKASRGEVFRFYEFPGHLTDLLRDWPRFRLLRSDGRICKDAVIWVEERFFAIPVAMAFRIHRWEPPLAFGGRMVHGPFARFVHEHEFHDVAGGTRIHDLVDLAVPLRFGGDWMLRHWIAPLVRRAFAARQDALTRIFGGPAFETDTRLDAVLPIR